MASVLAPAVPNPDTDDEPSMTSEEDSEDERVPNHLASVRTLTYQATNEKLLAPVTHDPTPEDLEAQECVRSRIAKIEKELLCRRATTVKCHRKTNGAKRLLAASCVAGVVTTQEGIVSPEVELMRKHILADYERDVFSGEVRLRPGQEHPKVRGTERLGFAKLDLYQNAKPKSVKPIRLVGERAAAEQEIVEDVSARCWIEPCPASKWAFNGFVVVSPPAPRGLRGCTVQKTVSLSPRRRRENGASLWTIANSMRLPCPTHTPSPSLGICWKINPNTRFSLLWT